MKMIRSNVRLPAVSSRKSSRKHGRADRKAQASKAQAGQGADVPELSRPRAQAAQAAGRRRPRRRRQPKRQEATKSAPGEPQDPPRAALEGSQEPPRAPQKGLKGREDLCKRQFGPVKYMGLRPRPSQNLGLATFSKENLGQTVTFCIPGR